MISGLKAFLLTPPGDGGISVIALTGPGALAYVSAHLASPSRTPREISAGALSYGHFRDSGGTVLDEVIVAASDSEHVEINCHGGAIPARRILESLAADGVKMISSDRAADVLSQSLIEREAREALEGAVTELAARVLAAQLGGVLHRRVREAVTALASTPTRIEEATATLRDLIASSTFGRLLVAGGVIAVVGPVNAGKSTLVNSLAGFERNIVSPIAGTTRDAVEVQASLFGVPVTLVDTAGAGAGSTELDVAASERAKRAAAGADVTLVVVDASAPLPEGFALPKAGAVVAANKCDLAADADTVKRIHASAAPVVSTSAPEGRGLDELSRALLGALGVPVPAKDAATKAVVFTERQFTLVTEALAAVERNDLSSALAALGRL